MKKLTIFLVSFLIFSSCAYAINIAVWSSSNTATADTTKNLCPGLPYLIGTSTVTEGNHGIIHGACINSGQPGTLTVYNSSATATNPIFALSTSTAMPCSQYDVAVSSGLTYSNSSTANVTLTYTCY